jgi:hypothetical protein
MPSARTGRGPFVPPTSMISTQLRPARFAPPVVKSLLGRLKSA